ncbi:hypothetical protein EGW08_014681 [Elysia chlorotica]|uniref:Uncharacterized protein n=1 Tax=Elysia chlorotica TaxID=188477 RepID=A0A3S1HE77_ELYCH|nr:hypothetical protein EGW08_014681 [Elysia chlorotica]
MAKLYGVLVLLATIYGNTAVTIPPKIIDQSPVDIYYKDGESIKLKCKASGMPAPKYTWERADTVFSPEGNEDRVVQMRDEGTIIINRPEDKDEGFYQCFAKNSFGVAASIKFNLRQAKLKSFSFSPPKTYTPRLGTSLSLACPSPDSVPDAEIYWAKGSTPIQWDARVSVDYDDKLHFSYVDQTDDGSCFHCVATNNIMRKSVKGPLHCIKPTGQSLTTAPMYLAWPDSQYDSLGMVGETVKLKCIFSGYPLPTVYWTKKGSPSFNQRVKTGNSGGQELVITDLQLEDKGTYVCSATQVQSDKQMEMSINLNVEYRLPRSAEFQCEGTGEPSVTVSWFINGQTLEDNRLDKDRFHSSRNKLLFQNVRLTDTLVVQCNVTNNNGFVWAEAFLNVLEEKPTILEVPENTRVAEGQNLKLNCKITGKPDPTITWYKDGVQITGGRYIILETGSLIATTAVLSDAGQYLCHAQNVHGEVQAGATVIVRRKTVIEMAPMDLEVQTGVNAKFTCSGTTDPEDNSLTISGTEERDTGSYECLVSNGLDSDRRSARLVVTDRPQQNSRVRVDNNCALNNEAELSWMPGASNNAPIQYYTVEYETTVYPNHWVFAAQVNYTQVKSFIPLAPGLDYRFRVTSYNKIGPSPPSDPSTTRCKTRPRAPSQSPRNVRTIGDIPNTLHIEWTPVPPEHQGGPGFKYVLNILRIGDDQSNVLSATILDWTRYKYNLTGPGGSYIPYQIGISSTNDVGNTTDNSQAIIGHTGEGMPDVSPYNLQVLDSGSEQVNLQWEFDSSQIGKTDTKIRGEFRGFKIQIWQKNKRSTTITNIDLLPENFNIDANSNPDIFSARVQHFRPNTALEARVAVLNNFYVSAPSEVIGFDSLPGLPGPVAYLQELNVGDQHINLQWQPSLDNNKDIIGYAIGYQEVHGLRLGKLQERVPQIEDPFATTAVIGGLKPSTKYRIFVWARTQAGRGEPYFIERSTAKPGVPLIPRFTISHIGRHSINVTWWKDAYQESGNVVLVEYMKKDGREWVSTNPEASQNWASLRMLEPGTDYWVRILVTNGASVRRLSETQDVKTRGTSKAYDVSENLGWFLGTLFAVLLQIGLTVLFVVCYRKGFRFQPAESAVQTYTDKGHAYSDQAALPRASSAFEDIPLGYNNDYYRDTDRYDYSDHDEQRDPDGRGEGYYGDHANYNSDEDYGFRTREDEDHSREYADTHEDEQRDSDCPPYYKDDDERRHPREDTYGRYDIDDVDHGRRYPSNMSQAAPSDTGSDETREAAYRTEGYSADLPTDVNRDEPRNYEGREDSRLDGYEARGTHAGTGSSRSGDAARRQLVDELRERQSARTSGLDQPRESDSVFEEDPQDPGTYI